MLWEFEFNLILGEDCFQSVMGSCIAAAVSALFVSVTNWLVIFAENQDYGYDEIEGVDPYIGYAEINRDHMPPDMFKPDIHHTLKYRTPDHRPTSLAQNLSSHNSMRSSKQYSEA